MKLTKAQVKQIGRFLLAVEAANRTGDNGSIAAQIIGNDKGEAIAKVTYFDGKTTKKIRRAATGKKDEAYSSYDEYRDML